VDAGGSYNLDESLGDDHLLGCAYVAIDLLAGRIRCAQLHLEPITIDPRHLSYS
jgi:hypothetical protein